MVINDEVSKEINGHKEVLAINVYRFNNITVEVEGDLDENELVCKIAESIKSRYKFFKVARKDNVKADVFMVETTIGDLNEMTIVDPSDMLPTEMIQTQLVIGEILESEGFSELKEAEIEEFNGEENIEEIVEEVK